MPAGPSEETRAWPGWKEALTGRCTEHRTRKQTDCGSEGAASGEEGGLLITLLGKVSLILKAQHPSIITCRRNGHGQQRGQIYTVMSCVDHDLKSLMETMKQPFLGEVKTLMLPPAATLAKHLQDKLDPAQKSKLLLSRAGILRCESGHTLTEGHTWSATPWCCTSERLLGAEE